MNQGLTALTSAMLAALLSPQLANPGELQPPTSERSFAPSLSCGLGDRSCRGDPVVECDGPRRVEISPCDQPLVASLLLVVRPGAPSSFLFLVAMPGAPGSVLAPRSLRLTGGFWDAELKGRACRVRSPPAHCVRFFF